MSPGAASLLARLRALALEGRRRVELERLWRAFAEVEPARASDADARERLRALLVELESANAVSLPRDRALWDRTATPHLPHWARVSAHGDLVKPARRDHRTFAWAPELSFVAGLTRVDNLAELFAIQRFLSAGGRERDAVPMRERSIELFGDEKRLEQLLRNVGIFGDGRLTLETLRCFRVPVPAVWRAGPAQARGRALLVVENHHTYHSLCRWNDRHARWSGVVYGDGNAFSSLVPDLGRIVSEAVTGSGIEYFGDLDGAGLAIPAKAAREAEELGLPPLRPAIELYELLMTRGDALDIEALDSTRVTEEGLAWLTPALRERATSWLDHGLRLAQELVGWEVLGQLATGADTAREPMLASTVRNYLLDDPLLDWLELYGEKNGFTRDVETPWDFSRFVQERASEFETRVIKLIEARAEVVHVMHDRGRTLEAMRRGAPVIAGAELIDERDGMIARPSLLVRSDALERIVPGNLAPEEAQIAARDLEGAAWHYRVVEIRFATLDLDGQDVVSDQGGGIAIKGLAVLHNRVLGARQGYLAPAAFVLGRGRANCFERLGTVPHLHVAAARVDVALEWARRVRSSGSEWSVLPEPSVPELYPNAGNDMDAPWHGAKSRIARELEELTLLWHVGPEARRKTHAAGIRRFSDPKCTAALLGLGDARGRTLDAILEAQRSSSVPAWSSASNLLPREAVSAEFFVDFETVSDLDDDFARLPERGGVPMIFMIGCGHAEGEQWCFRSFTAAKMTKATEAGIVAEWLDYVRGVNERLGRRETAPTVFHWSAAEVSSLRRASPDVVDLGWFDLLERVVKAHPITASGALAFGLKDVARALHRLGWIDTEWGDGPGDGLAAMSAAWWCEREARRRGVPLHELEVMRSIERYNEVDCRAMWEIVRLLRRGR